MGLLTTQYDPNASHALSAEFLAEPSRECATHSRKVFMRAESLPPGFEDLLKVPFVDALFGRRSRRFALGATIPDGPLALPRAMHRCRFRK